MDCHLTAAMPCSVVPSQIDMQARTTPQSWKGQQLDTFLRKQTIDRQLVTQLGASKKVLFTKYMNRDVSSIGWASIVDIQLIAMLTVLDETCSQLSLLSIFAGGELAFDLQFVQTTSKLIDFPLAKPNKCRKS